MHTALLFCCFLLVVGSHGSTSVMRHLLAIKPTDWPKTGDCTSKVKDPTSPCDKIINAYTGDKDSGKKPSEKIRSKIIKSATGLITGTLKYESFKPDFCTAVNAYKACVDQTLKDCGKKAEKKVGTKRKSVILLSKFVEKTICHKSDSLAKKLKSFDKCAASIKDAKVTIKVTKSLEQLVKTGQCNAAATAANRIRSIYSSSKECKTKIGPMANFVVRLLVRPDRSCDDKKFKDEKKPGDRGDPKSKKRMSAQFISLNHYLLGVENFKSAEKKYITCQDEESTRNVTFFEWDFFTLECELVPSNDTGIPNTQCRSACVTIKDSQYEEVEKKCLSASKSFEKEGRTIKKGKQKGGGKLANDIKITAIGKGKALKFQDKNSGTMIILRRISYKPKTSPERKYMLLITLRTSKSVLENSSGRLVKACENVKDIAAAVAKTSRRRKRSASSIAKFDAQSTGDPEAGNFVSLADSDATSAESDDTSYSTSGQDQVLFTMPLLLLPIVAALAM